MDGVTNVTIQASSQDRFRPLKALPTSGFDDPFVGIPSRRSARPYIDNYCRHFSLRLIRAGGQRDYC